MNSLRETILDILESHCDEENRLVEKLELVIRENGRQTYSVIFEIITQLKLDPVKAEYLWKEVLENREEMMKLLGRNVGIRTALCDYLCTVNKTLENPMVVEIQVFDYHYKSYMFDYLTGLYSRGFLDTILDREIARSRRHSTELSLIFFDIDNFKNVNDTYGHAAGDRCLTGVANIISKAVRTEDTAVRYGGEEIVLILPQTGKMYALAIGERIRRQVEQEGFSGKGGLFYVTMSGGLVSFPMDGNDAAELLEHADQAMYMAKGSGKNTIVPYSREKRRYIRVDFENPVEVRPIGISKDPDTCLAEGRNISSGGVLFKTGIFYGIGTRLQLRIPLSSSDNSIEISGMVVRNELNPDGTYESGISFLEMDEEVKDEIFLYLKSRLSMLENEIYAKSTAS